MIKCNINIPNFTKNLLYMYMCVPGVYVDAMYLLVPKRPEDGI